VIPHESKDAPEHLISELGARLFAEGLDIGETLDAVADVARRALGANRATLYAGYPEGRVTSVHTTATDRAHRDWILSALGRRVDDLPLAEVLAGGDPLFVIPDTARLAPELATLAASLGAGSMLGVRLRGPRSSGGAEILGHLLLTWRTPAPLGSRERSGALAFAGFAASALVRARLQAEGRAALIRARRSEAAMARAKRVARLGNFSWSPPTGHVEWSPEVYDVAGLDPAECMDIARAFAAFHPDDRERIAALCEEVSRTGAPLGFQVRMLAPDGTERVIIALAEADVHDASGAPLRYVGVVQEITDLFRAEQDLRVSEASRKGLAAEQAALRRVATAVAGNAEPDDIFVLVAREVAELLGAEASVICRFEGSGATVVGASGGHAFQPGRAVPLTGRATLAEVARTGRPARTQYRELTGDPTARSLVADGLRTGIAAPVHVAGRLWGAVAAATTSASGADPDGERRLADFAELVALAIANAEARRELAAQADSDPLTGLANHRVFHERLHDEVERARRHGRALALVLFDLDHFKRVNDVHGHQAGDRVLAEVAGSLAGLARAGDVVARVGGEEFAWLMPEANAMEAYSASERARALVAAHPGPGGEVLTMSAGVCDMEHATSASEMISLADGALYWAKANGRDAVFLYSPAVVEALSAEERARQLERQQALSGLRALARAVDAKDRHTQEHSQRVADLSAALATAVGWPAERVATLHEAGLVHDVGKIGVPDAILSKPSRLTDEEYAKVKEHAALGAEIAGEILSAEQTAWVRGHHERWDGRGYPDGLSGEEVPEGARIMAMADAFDVMTSSRSYKAAMSWEDALAECRRCAGSQFDPRMVEALATLDPLPPGHPRPWCRTPPTPQRHTGVTRRESPGTHGGGARAGR
jgi:diguanylate cyclase (GGDEF)-like protein